jgi:soluble lytic murein transglycosylase-like protein
MTKLFLLTILSILLYAPDQLTGFEKMREYFPELQKDVWAEVYPNSLKNKLDPALVCSVIRKESNFDKYAENKISKAQSLMQIHPVHGNYKDWKKNIAFGTSHLRELIDMTGGDIPVALAKYHAGPNYKLINYRHWRTYGWRICFKAYELRDVRI